MNKEIQNLLDKCEIWEASILRVDVTTGTGIVELKNGTPSSTWYNEETKEWE